VTGSPFDGAPGARRTLHRDRPGREGMEAELVSRLAAGLGPEPARRALVRCLDGELTARAALAQLLLVTRSVTAVRELVDEVTARTDSDSRAGDSLVRDRADALTRLVVENEGAFALRPRPGRGRRRRGRRPARRGRPRGGVPRRRRPAAGRGRRRGAVLRARVGGDARRLTRRRRRAPRRPPAAEHAVRGFERRGAEPRPRAADDEPGEHVGGVVHAQ
jgi:hypothetical protein